jgi:hypothetical protein
MEAKMDKAVIRDTERGEELTLTALREEYENLKNAGETEAETFEDYLENITDGNAPNRKENTMAKVIEPFC